eukprot:TRINITY_DN6151_c0_g3_i1.p1 TRINITY_DN6151_c0_g3~~TRINITY_DN6151_c0_g3_i1.p1  ORF type:complete len:296 (+),score=95.94 TRINITY_DN6151_c0_g3_i1:53-940(+)
MLEAIQTHDYRKIARVMEDKVVKQEWVDEAVATGNAMALTLLKKHGAVVGEDAVEKMVKLGHVGVCVLLDSDNTNTKGKALVAMAAASGHNDLAEVLLERSFDPNEKDASGNTALHYAAKSESSDLVKSLILFKAKNDLKNKDGKVPADLIPATNKQLIKEVNKTPVTGEKAAAMAARFKAQGNKVFAEGEFCKAAKFYTASISHDAGNHVLYSNRSACFFNQKKYTRGLADAAQCVALNPSWAKGYFRKGSCLVQLELPEAAMETYEAGLKIDKKNNDLVKARDQLLKDMKNRK